MINSFSQKLSTWVTAESDVSTRIDFLLLTNVTFLRAITMCRGLKPDYGYDKSAIILIGDVYCPNTRCSRKFCLHKKTFESLDKSDYQCPHCASAFQVRNILFLGSKEFLFLVIWSRGLHLWRDSKVNSRCYWRCALSRWILCQHREMQISWRLCNNSEIHLWLWKVWSMVVCSQSSFCVTTARKDDKNR